MAMRIAGREIGPGAPCFIIAELSANHNGDKNKALEIVQAAAEAGADAIKLQTYTADTMTIDHDSDDFRIAGGLWDGYTLHQLYDEAHTPWEWHQELFATAHEHGLVCLSSPFDGTAVDFLENLQAPVYKLASFEINDHRLIRKIALTGKPMIMSCGMSTFEEIDAAVGVARQHGCDDIAVLKCVSSYPANPSDFNLRTMQELRERLQVIVGLSDHSIGSTVAVTAVALGASIIEKHIIMHRSDGGPDSSFSMEANEFAQMVSAIREAEASIGQVAFGPRENEKQNVCFRRSIYVVEDIKSGEHFTDKNIRLIRPGYGLAAHEYEDVLRCQAKKDLMRGTALSKEHVEQTSSVIDEF
ncbi:MAG: pseudaminic acid synthase [Planctomycetes bacterium]|nr:pseudaminic acid synthase [Planctomycetota bacterium]